MTFRDKSLILCWGTSLPKQMELKVAPSRPSISILLALVWSSVSTQILISTVCLRGTSNVTGVCGATAPTGNALTVMGQVWLCSVIPSYRVWENARLPWETVDLIVMDWEPSVVTWTHFQIICFNGQHRTCNLLWNLVIRGWPFHVLFSLINAFFFS